jgi:hypothetical protein
MDNEFNDNLDHLFDGKAEKPRQGGIPEWYNTDKPYLPSTAKKAPSAGQALYEDKCDKCNGSGRFGFRQQLRCFKCDGKGVRKFKTSPEARRSARDTSAERKTAKRDAFHEEYRELIQWTAGEATKQDKRREAGKKVWDFPVEMLASLTQYGTWTDNQIAALEKCRASAIERAAEWAAQDQAREASKPVVDASLIAAAFAKAKIAAAEDGEGVMDLKLRLDTFVFFPDRSGNSDIWIREGENWLGKIIGNKFNIFRKCSQEQQDRILIAAADPLAAAKAFGQRFKSCSCCGRTLTDPKSRELGIGPICARKWF